MYYNNCNDEVDFPWKVKKEEAVSKVGICQVEHVET